MIAYILKSAICLTVLLAVYHVLLERKKMHRFNRFYLLMSLAIGLILPLLTIEISAGALDDAPLLSKAIAVEQAPLAVEYTIAESIPAQNEAFSYNTETLFVLFYGLITTVLVIRFARNLVKIKAQVRQNPTLKLDKASLVLLPNDDVPYSFLNYVFVNEHEYKNGRVEQQLLEHEFTHVRQRHSLDVLFIECLKILFWFNPVFIFYKNAIQLNHEFLADEAVLNTYEVSEYQYLLLERSILHPATPLTSNLNYSLTKKRLTMMIKTTSKLKIWAARLAVVPVFATLLVFFSMKSIPDVPELKPAALNTTPAKTDDPKREAFFKGSTIWIENKQGKYIPRKYDDMTAVEKAAIPSPKLPGDVPSSNQFELWTTQPDTYAVWIDGKYVTASQLKKYNPGDFPLYRSRKPGSQDLLVNPNYGKFAYLVNLYTRDGYAKRFLKDYDKPGKWMAVFKGELWPGFSDGAEAIKWYFEYEKHKAANPGKELMWALPPFKPEKI